MRTTSLAALLVLLVLWSGTLLVAAPPRLSMKVWPRVAVVPGNAFVTIVVEREAGNRTLVFEADGPDFYRASYRQLDGASSPRTHQLSLKGLPTGSFSITATVIRADGSKQHVHSTIEVRGDSDDARAFVRQDP